MQKKVAVSDAEGDQISKEIADATREGVEKGGKAAKESFTGAVSKVLSADMSHQRIALLLQPSSPELKVR